ncbi:MAG: hypothetical protein QOC95_498 [Thermoleophilaceae bacterium]|nr:hypothetical protein [Thermoleophilaceae bacterium]
MLVVGVGRSGTSLLTGVLGQLGFHVPQPEVRADDTNPRGFSEPRWAVDFHTELLQKRRVTVNDARPAAWQSTAGAAEDPAVRAQLRTWLEAQMDMAGAVVVKDPRTGWFLPLWTACSADLGVEARFITMLRHPAEILASATKSYGTWQTPASRVAAWINITLETERAPRGRRRAFVRYADLLEDWPRDVNRVAELLDLPMLAGVDRESSPAVEGFVDPALYRNREDWGQFDVPARIREMAEDVWRELQPLADPGGDTPELQRTLDHARGAYGELYREAEDIAQSSVTAAKPRRKAAKDKPQAPKTPPSLRVRVARRVPAPLRRRLRRAVGARRRSG